MSTDMGNKIRRKKPCILLAKGGLDGHDRGIKIVAMALKDAGMDVVYTGVHHTPEEIIDAAIKEGADAIGISIHSGAHNYVFSRVIALLKDKGRSEIKVFGGGIIPEEDIPGLEKVGVSGIFTPGASTSEIVEFVKGILGSKRK